MAIISIDEEQRWSAWRRLMAAVDAYFAKRTSRAVPEATLRRARREVERCRRLMHRHIEAPVAAAAVAGRPRHQVDANVK
jgi:hypothetical protein